jgi:hypothetical protein
LSSKQTQGRLKTSIKLRQWHERVQIIGTATVSGIATFFTSFKWTLTSLWSNIDNGMMAFAESVRYITDMSYYGMIDFMYLKRETYIGLLICLLIFLFIANVFKTLKQRGMTFPGIRDLLGVVDLLKLYPPLFTGGN